MGLWLRRRLPNRRVFSLDVGYTEGEVWICTSGEPESCGVQRVSGNEQRPWGIHLAPAEDRGHYSGHYVVGTLQASPPAVTPP